MPGGWLALTTLRLVCRSRRAATSRPCSCVPTRAARPTPAARQTSAPERRCDPPSPHPPSDTAALFPPTSQPCWGCVWPSSSSSGRDRGAGARRLPVAAGPRLLLLRLQEEAAAAAERQLAPRPGRVLAACQEQHDLSSIWRKERRRRGRREAGREGQGDRPSMAPLAG